MTYFCISIIKPRARLPHYAILDRKVEDIAAIMERGVLSTPALVKDGKVLVAGKLPTPKEIAALIQG